MSHVVRAGVAGTEKYGIFFTEAEVPASRRIKHARVESRKQNIGLDTLKEQLARQAIACGADCVASFKYSQSATIFSYSDIRWVGEGDLVALPLQGASTGVGSTLQPPPPPPPSVPAAWYPDPTTPGQQRYWDGAAWTTHVAPG